MMRMSDNENKVVSALAEEIMDEMRGEPAAIQIKVGFAVLASVLGNAARQDPTELKRAAAELELILKLVH
jgi:hypothetical protein